MSAELNTTAVAAWLGAHLAGFSGPVSATKFSGGQSNPTYLLKTPARNYVLRRKPPGVLLKSAHAVEREFRVQRALEGSDVPVAKMHILCEDETVIGSPFYIMDEVEGRNFDSPSLPGMTPPERGALIDEMNRVLAAIHDVDITAVGLSDYGPSGNYYRRQVDRWSKQYSATQTDDLPDMTALIDWLDGNIPADDGQRTLVHGDYRLDNLLFSKDDARCLAVLDWELSTIGHPYADLAAVIMQWSMPATREGRGLAGVDRTALGLWSDQQFIERYCARRGLADIDNFGFYLAFCYFRMAAILQGVKKRALDGNASDPERGLQLGQYVPAFARQGLEAAKGVL
ncbi:Putative aminoglycoside phosphotransferase [Roseovarius gaetbuli]|uniref:Putative aminoglycoside phosphotransferase n=1 Tax=Roseovarius gaetbuli TaxID=1356575 RepID=A0A1X6ZJT1_9RHOB|nr:phosphotransferase family protein [Roseovarius gaetbuli]SLN52867.1 Putative aminoglycoside phosphotransferase [Roseovarius gaetbuli]